MGKCADVQMIFCWNVVRFKSLNVITYAPYPKNIGIIRYSANTNDLMINDPMTFFIQSLKNQSFNHWPGGIL